MAKRKKKLAGLGGSPEFHLNAAREALKVALEERDMATRAARKGSCLEAMTAYAVYKEQEGELAAHTGSEPSIKKELRFGIRDLNDHHNEFTEMVFDACVVGQRR